MAVGILSIGLTLASLGLSAYSAQAQGRAQAQQAKTEEAKRRLNLTKYGLDLETQRTGILEESKMAISQIQANDARRNAGVNTATQSLVQGVMADVATTEKNIERNMKDAEFNVKIADSNSKINLANNKANAGLNFLGQVFSAGIGLVGEHQKNVALEKTESALTDLVGKNTSSIKQITDSMKF